MGTPERRPGQQHLFRVSSVPPKFGVALSAPHCLTCLRLFSEEMSTTTNPPPKLATSWDDDWEAEPTDAPAPTSTPKKKKKKGEKFPLYIVIC